MFDEIEAQKDTAVQSKHKEQSMLKTTTIISVIGFALIIFAVILYTIIYSNNTEEQTQVEKETTVVKQEIVQEKETQKSETTPIIKKSTTETEFTVESLLGVSEVKEGMFVVTDVTGVIRNNQLYYKLKGKVKENKIECELIIDYNTATKVKTGMEFLVTYSEIEIKSKLFLLDLKAK